MGLAKISTPINIPSQKSVHPLLIEVTISRFPYSAARTPMVELLRYEPGIYALDAGYLRPQLAAIYLIVEQGRVAVVDTATNACLPRTLAVLRALALSPSQVDYVFLTHVHLDHAGGAGAMMQAFPEARLVVHPRGVRHMADPTPLFAAVQSVYGEIEAHRLYGELLPVPADRILAAADGFPLDLGGRTLVCLDTPGHARHHLSLLDVRSGGIFTGEAFGLSLRELDVAGRPSILPAIAPTQFDPVAMQASVERILALQPPALYLAHFGQVREASRLGDDLLRQIEAQVALAELEWDAGPARGARLLTGLWELVKTEAARQGWRLAARPLHALLDEYLALNAQALDGWLAQTMPRPSGEIR